MCVGLHAHANLGNFLNSSIRQCGGCLIGGICPHAAVCWNLHLHKLFGFVMWGNEILANFITTMWTCSTNNGRQRCSL